MTYMQTFNTYSYRVKILDDTLEINGFGLDKITFEGKPVPLFLAFDQAPLWLERKMATLLTLPYEPPTVYVNGLGRRIARNIFWVEYDGSNTGEESKGESG